MSQEDDIILQDPIKVEEAEKVKPEVPKQENKKMDPIEAPKQEVNVADQNNQKPA